MARVRQHVVGQLVGASEDALAERVASDAPLSEEDQATVDAIMHGTGFLVDDKRVAPERVRLIRWDAP